MPTAALRACRCGALVRGRCSTCTRQADQRRGTDTERGYGIRWKRFVAQVRAEMVQQGIPVVCGATLPGGPNTAAYSQCQQEGRLNGWDLQLDHEPPLTAAERAAARAGDRRAVDDRTRTGWLCRRCHQDKTMKQVGRKA